MKSPHPFSKFKRRPKDFADLSPEKRAIAKSYVWRACDKWKKANDLPNWRYALICAAARQFVKNPRGSEWGRKMRRIKGGKRAVRTNRSNGWPNTKALNVTMARKREAKAKAAARAKVGLPPTGKRGFTAGNAPE